MTVKELYEKAVAEGYENAEIGLHMTLHSRDIFDGDRDIYDEVLEEAQIDFGELYEKRERIGDCIWIYMEADE